MGASSLSGKWSQEALERKQAQGTENVKTVKLSLSRWTLWATVQQRHWGIGRSNVNYALPEQDGAGVCTHQLLCVIGWELLPGTDTSLSVRENPQARGAGVYSLHHEISMLSACRWRTSSISCSMCLSLTSENKWLPIKRALCNYIIMVIYKFIIFFHLLRYRIFEEIFLWWDTRYSRDCSALVESYH